MEAAGCSAEEIVVVGDSEDKDINPALGLRMRTVLVAIETAPPPTSDAHAVVASLDQAAQVIADWVPR